MKNTCEYRGGIQLTSYRLHQHKKASGLSVDEVSCVTSFVLFWMQAKKIMFSTARLQEFAEELSSQEVKLQRVYIPIRHRILSYIAQVAMLIYSGTAGYMFRQMVENEVRKEYGFEPKYVPDEDSYYS